MDDLVQFLRARLDEDEQIARRASEYAEAEWRLDAEDEATVLWWPPEPHIAAKEQEKGLPVVSDQWRGQTIESSGHRIAPHVARHDPARVLREVEGRRQLLALHEPTMNVGTDSDPDNPATYVMCCGTCQIEVAKPGDWPCEHLRLLALPYADHPDYLQAWRP